MLTAAGSPLVAGSVVSASTMTKKVKVLRPFMLEGKPTKVGEVVSVSDSAAFEVVTSKKAELFVDPPAPPPADPEASKGRGSKKDAS